MTPKCSLEYKTVENQCRHCRPQIRPEIRVRSLRHDVAQARPKGLSRHCARIGFDRLRAASETTAASLSDRTTSSAPSLSRRSRTSFRSTLTGVGYAGLASSRGSTRCRTETGFVYHLRHLPTSSTKACADSHPCAATLACSATPRCVAILCTVLLGGSPWPGRTCSQAACSGHRGSARKNI